MPEKPMSGEFDACPFCGGPANFGWFNLEANVDCPSCQFSMFEYAESEEDAERAKQLLMSKWNRRASALPPPGSAAEMAAVERMETAFNAALPGSYRLEFPVLLREAMVACLRALTEKDRTDG